MPYKDPEKRRANSRRRYAANPGVQYAATKRWRAKSPEKVAAGQLRYDSAHRAERRAARRAHHYLLTHQPLVGPLTDYYGELTYLTCPGCGAEPLIDLELRPLACPECGVRVTRDDVWLRVVPKDGRSLERKAADQRSRRAARPEMVKAQNLISNARRALRKRQQATRVWNYEQRRSIIPSTAATKGS